MVRRRVEALSDAIRALGLDVRTITRDERAPELRVLAVA